MTEKRYAGPEDYPQDRLTISVRKGYKGLLQKAALEWNTDLSKLARKAIEQMFESRSHLMSDELKKEWEELRTRYGGRGHHWTELL